MFIRVPWSKWQCPVLETAPVVVDRPEELLVLLEDSGDPTTVTSISASRSLPLSSCIRSAADQAITSPPSLSPSSVLMQPIRTVRVSKILRKTRHEKFTTDSGR